MLPEPRLKQSKIAKITEIFHDFCRFWSLVVMEALLLRFLKFAFLLNRVKTTLCKNMTIQYCDARTTFV